MGNRIRWIDSAKGIAMLSVVICHVTHGLNEAGLYSQYRNFLFAIENICDMFQMPLFTAASGYIFYKVYFDNNEVKKKKLHRQLINLTLLYLIWELILWIVKYIMSSKVNESVGIRDLLCVPFNPIGPFWYLWLMLGLYIIFSNSYINTMSYKILLPILIWVGMIGGWFRVLGIYGECFLFYASFFYIGILLAKYKKRPNNIIYFVIGIITITLIIIKWNYNKKIYYTPVFNYIVALGLTICILRFIEYLKNIKYVSYVGEHSIEVYTMHVFITSGGRVLLQILNIQNIIIAVFLLFILGFGLPIIMATVMRKIKIYNIFFKPSKIIWDKK